jgi:hypothetical protein
MRARKFEKEIVSFARHHANLCFGAGA